MSIITPFLWITAPASEVRNYYKSIFKEEADIDEVNESFDDTPGGKVDIFTMTLKGQDFRVMCTGAHDEFTDAISFELPCKDQTEIDYYWEAITAEGEESQCGWCRDKYGVRWQVVPENSELFANPAAVQAMLGMKKLIIEDLLNAK